MKKIFAAVLAALALAACGPDNIDNHQVVDIVQNVVSPGRTYNYQAAFAQALACDPATLVWSITEPGDHAAATCLDGCVSSAGAFTAPNCGSAYIGTTVHVTAYCPGNALTGTAAIAVSQELLQSLDVAAAVVFPGTPQACIAHTPTNITIPIGAQIQYYARLTFTCQTVWPVTPPTVGAFNPPLTYPQCSTAVSP
jgi:hypothetical protein